MLSRFIRTPVQRFARCSRAAFSVSEASNAEEICLPDAQPDGVVNLQPVDEVGLLNGLGQAEADGLMADTEEADEPGYLDAIGLGPFHRRASLVATGAITAISNEFYVLNEETFVAGCLVAGFTVMYVNLREPALEAFNTFQEETLKAQRDAEEMHIAACQTLINAQSGSDKIVDAVKVAFQEKEQLVHAEATAKALAEKNKVAKDFEAKLQALVNRKSDEENKAYKQLIDNVYEQVLSAATSDKAFKKSALQYALTAITSAEKAGANPTVELYASKLKQ